MAAALTVTFGELLGLNEYKPVVQTSNLHINDNLIERLEHARVKRIAAIDAEVKKQAEIARRKEAAKAKRNAIARRNDLIAELHNRTVVRTRKDGTRYMAAKPGQANYVKFIRNELANVSTQCRPDNGYPAPPPRRSDLYPKGGTWKHRRGNEIANVRGELTRLQTYAFNAHRAGKVDNDAMTKMAAHCQRLERRLALLGTETHIRRQQGTKYYRAVADAR